MAVIRVQEGWVSTETGHTYDSEQAARHYDDKELTIRRARMTRTEDENFDRLITTGGVSANTAEANRQIQRLTDEATEQQHRRYVAPGMNAVMNQWLDEHPHYINSEYNGNQMRSALIMLYGRAEPRDTTELDAAMEGLVRIGALQVVADIEKQKKMSADELYVATQIALQRKGSAQATPEPESKTPSEQEMYAMPLDELRRGSGAYDPLGPRG